ncbi:MAG: hypothetical protein JJU36_07305 [Phycisphaeraceae bacterium]|nr:hypothetical protein [Phycisphaeraceae bacterium]
MKWEDRLEERRREYQANRERLLSDWRIAIEEVRRGELDAGKLYQQIVDLTRRLEEEQQRLEQWTVELHQWEETLLR